MDSEKTTWFKVKLIFPHKIAYLTTSFINGRRILSITDSLGCADVFSSVMSAVENVEAFMVRYEGGRFAPYYEIIEE